MTQDEIYEILVAVTAWAAVVAVAALLALAISCSAPRETEHVALPAHEPTKGKGKP